MPKKSLSQQQQRFLDEYMKCGNAAEAARCAGYKDKDIGAAAYRILERPSVQAEYQRRLQAMQKATIAKVDEILQFHTSVMRGEITEPIVAPDGQLIESPASITVRQKSADTLLKHAVNVPKDKLKIKKLKAEIDQLKKLAAKQDEVTFNFNFEAQHEN